MKECLGVTSRKEKHSALCLVSHQRRLEVLNHLVILLVLGLDQSVLPSPSDLLNSPSLVHHYQVPLLEVGR